MDDETTNIIVDKAALERLLSAFGVTYDKLTRTTAAVLDGEGASVTGFTPEQSRAVLAGMNAAEELQAAIHDQAHAAPVGYTRGQSFKTRPSGQRPLFAVPYTGTEWLEKRWHVVDKLAAAFLNENDAPVFGDLEQIAFDGDSRNFWLQVGLRCNEYGYSTYSTEGGFAVFPRQTLAPEPKHVPVVPSARRASHKPFSPAP